MAYAETDYIKTLQQIPLLEESRYRKKGYRLYKLRAGEFASIREKFNLPDSKVGVEIGCGCGIFSILMSFFCDTLVAIDKDQICSSTHSEGLSEIGYLKGYFNRRNIDIISAEAQSLPLRDESVDFIISHFVFEHIVDKKTAVSEIRRVLKKDGFAVITVPNLRNRLSWAVRYFFGVNVIKNYIKPLYRIIFKRCSLKTVFDDFYFFIPPHDKRFSFLKECILYREKSWDALFSSFKTVRKIYIRRDAVTYFFAK